jgi:ABC-type uncharacterized transport system YnjBCD substrate-binding protein
MLVNSKGAYMADKKPTYEELQEQLEEMKKKEANLSFKVSDKGGVSVYGLGRFPVTLYYEQWQKLFDNIEQLKTFVKDNKKKMKMKE